jgi:hypothetical protein
MARAMYALLTPTPFQIPDDPGPLAIYYPIPTAIVDNAGAPVINAEGQPISMCLRQLTLPPRQQSTLDSAERTITGYCT